jgi:hypothetical protein
MRNQQLSITGTGKEFRHMPYIECLDHFQADQLTDENAVRAAVSVLEGTLDVHNVEVILQSTLKNPYMLEFILTGTS